MTTRLELAEGWRVRLAEDADPALVPEAVRTALPIPATVPGSVHTDLLAAGLIPDPYLDLNELAVDWVGRVPWVFERELDVEPAPGEELTLLFEGLDTVATVTVGDTVVARTENQNRRHEVPITEALLAGGRTLAVRFDSAWERGEAERARIGDLPNQYPGPFAFLRKMACNFGWDWGPTLVTCGIWRPVTLVRSSGPRIREVLPTAEVHGSGGLARLDVRLAAPAAHELAVTATLGDQAGGPWTATATIPAGAEGAVLEVRVPEVELWWPIGLGGQPLYSVEVAVRDAEGATEAHDTWSDRLGFRSLRLDTEPDAEGTPFRIVVNGVVVPVRGVNWIPDDCFPGSIRPERLARRFTQATDANVNLLRVWGGGTYESRDFYRLADERGLLVWQDFLFACAAYPEDPHLAAEIEAEARDNVARLMPHPSLVLWNGNNENIWGYEDWDWKERIGERSWGLGYYLELLPRVMAATDPSRPYWPGSPYSGSREIHPNDPDHALVHLWEQWNRQDYLTYRDSRPRFVSEFGWQAPPTWSTLRRSVRDEPLTPSSPGVLHHQKAEDGDGKLARGLAPHLPAPEGLDDWLYTTQLVQARAVQTGLEYFRSLRPRCTGTIVWQLNDCWPVTSWAAVDGDGRRKPLWYAMRAAYAPRLLTIQPEGEGLVLVGVDDTGNPWREDATVRRVALDGTVLAEFRTRITADRMGAASVALPAALTTPGDPSSEVLVAETASTRALWFFAEDRDLALPEARLELDARRVGEVVEVHVTARSFVRDLCVFPDRIAPEAEADRAMLTLLPGESAVIRVTGVPEGRELELLSAPVLRTVDELVSRAGRAAA